MSYIRCLSNPEGFYIWSDGKLVHWWANKVGWGNKKDGPEFLVPEKIFEGLLKKYHENFGLGPIRYRGALLEEIHSSAREAWWANKCKGKKPKRDPNEYRWRFTYNGSSLVMWLVTLAYLSHPFESECRDKRPNPWFIYRCPH